MRNGASNPMWASIKTEDAVMAAKNTRSLIRYQGLALGANHYITKPFSGQDLMRKIRLCLAERKIVSTDSPAVG